MTAYCPHITSLSQSIWNYMSDVFSYKLKVSEIGITNHLIFDMVRFYGGSGTSFEAYCLHAKHEHLRGADIDLYIQNKTGNYNHYMLQAKVMSYNGRYKDISKWNPVAQFKTLINRAILEKATPLYLLYNGYTANSTHGNSAFGLSMIDANKIERLRHNQRFNTGYSTGQHSLYFDLLYPLGMEPYYNLFCDSKSDVRESVNQLSRDDIIIGDEYLKISNEPIVSDEEDEFLEQKESKYSARQLPMFKVLIDFEE